MGLAACMLACMLQVVAWYMALIRCGGAGLWSWLVIVECVTCLFLSIYQALGLDTRHSGKGVWCKILTKTGDVAALTWLSHRLGVPASRHGISCLYTSSGCEVDSWGIGLPDCDGYGLLALQWSNEAADCKRGHSSQFGLFYQLRRLPSLGCQLVYR